ncbi:MAG: hypothetical protein Q8O67_25530 [Deltaproteobacteria bacterium]|nr:hypothetical protein [Deltaproteobacteria bacterium]
MRRLLPVVVVVVAVWASGCSFYIGDLLEEARVNVAEGEGEGEGQEGEGEGEEGEGEGEGEEGEGETDPACEEEERLVIVRDDSVDVLQVFDLVPNRFVRRRPAGVVGNVNLENDDGLAVNGFGVDSFALGTAGRLYLTGGSFLYQLDAATLTQESIAGKPQVRSGGSAFTVQVVAGNVVMAGNQLDMFPEGAPIGTVTTEITGPNDDYHRSVRFTVGAEDFIAVNGRFGYVVLSSTAGAPPSPTVVYDEDFTENRFHEYGGGTFHPRGIAFDNTTKKLLLGDEGRVIVLEHANGFAIDPADDSADFVLPNAAESWVQAIATRGGFAWVLFERSADNLMKLDLSVSPPVAVDVATVDTDSFGRSITVGCKRVVVASFNQIIAVDRNDLSPITSLAITDLEHIAIFSRTALGLDGDDGT